MYLLTSEATPTIADVDELVLGADELERLLVTGEAGHVRAGRRGIHQPTVEPCVLRSFTTVPLSLSKV